MQKLCYNTLNTKLYRYIKMQLFKTGVYNPSNNSTQWSSDFLGYQAASQSKAITQAKLKRKGLQLVAVVEPVTENDLIESEE
jgi:hypothetical protein